MLKLGIFALVVGITFAQDSYVAILPSDIRPGVQLDISINILRTTNNAPVHVTASLNIVHDANVLAQASGDFQAGSPKMLTLNVPDNLRTATYQITVEGTNGLTFTNSTTLNYQSKSISTFIQTDKAMYKPGQTVNFRVFSIHPNLSVFNGPINVEIYDPNANKIKQWLNVQDASGVYTNFMIMDSQPVLGDWKIRAEVHGKNVDKVFTVAEYVLPKFEVTVELPSYSLSSDTEIVATVKAKYTYGKPVKGKVTVVATLVNWYRPYNYHGSEPAVNISTTLDGSLTVHIPLDVLKSAHYNNLNSVEVKVLAEVTESLTQITLNGSSQVHFYSHAEKIEFLKSNPKTFKPGLPYTAYVKVAQQDDAPLTGLKSTLQVHTTVTYELPEVTPTPLYYFGPRTSTYTLPEKSLTLTDSGIIAVNVDIPENATSISLQATYKDVRAYSTISKSYSPSDSYIQLFLQSNHIRAGHDTDIQFSVTSTADIGNLAYQVLSRGSIVYAGSVNGANRKTFDFQVPLTTKMAPNARIVAYYVRSDGEVVTDSISFDVEGTFENKVSISFDKSKAQPGDGINVDVTADPNSLVNLLAVDQSVLLLKSGNDITPSDVLSELKSYDTITHHNDFGPVFLGGPIGIQKRMIWWPYPVYYGGSDATQIFENAGVKVLTDALVYHHVEPHYYTPLHLHGFLMGVPMVNSVGSLASVVDSVNVPMSGSTTSHNTQSQSQLAEPKSVRMLFPETWLWTNETTGADGHARISTTVPDTITSWIASAFAVNANSGLGIAPSTAKVEAFKPFFVSLTLPYSVVRGEQLVLQANVFNYMTQDLNTVVTLMSSPDFSNVIIDAQGHEQYVSQDQISTVHIPAGEAKSVFFPIVPINLGMMSLTVKAQSTMAADAVKRQLLVEAEGVPKEYNTPIMVDLKHNTHFTESVEVTLPAGVVQGSQHVRISTIGDLMGPTVNGLDSLLRMPTGCGEQTMLGFAPDVFVTNYLTDTNQLTGDIEDKAINFMEKGYQRELTFQHKDGSFSAFGDRDDSGSMWLTAFVAKSFHQAKRHIFIDDQTLSRAIDWMIARQTSNGSFPEPGRVIHKDMQGGSASGTSLTAFVLISLLENNDLTGSIHQRITKASHSATAYLESVVPTLTDDYALAITTYALKLAHSHFADTAFHRLQQDAITKDGMTHWHKQEQTSTASHTFWQPPHRQANPSDIEMTAYALLVYAQKSQFADGLPVMKWITKQRNPHGGFSSTQDTVLALQALSQFAQMAYSKTFNMQITVTASQYSHQFTVNPQNALVLQTVELPAIPSQVSVSAAGSGMALVEVSVFFHVEQEIEQPSFEVDVTIMEETVNSMKVRTCTKWLKNGASGMTVQEFGIPSGFEADLESIGTIVGLKKIEPQNKKIVLYFDEITTTPTCLTMESIRTGLVAKTQPAAIRVYDYYEPANQVTKFYQSQLLKDSTICDVCEDCGCTTK